MSDKKEWNRVFGGTCWAVRDKDDMIKKYTHKGRDVTVAVSEPDAGVLRGYWAFTWEGNDYGVQASSSSVGPGCSRRLLGVLMKDVEFLIDDPEGYEKKAKEAEEAEAQACANRGEDRVNTNETYQGILSRAKEECGEGVEPYLRELWDYWVDG